MPSFSDATPAHWAQIRASTSVATYQVMESLKEKPMIRSDVPAIHTAVLAELILAGWVIESEAGEISLTEAGLKHLRSF
ncbi:hypothetical protein NKH72_21650 [Mesorhizobium sp. M0955]|uniref:hypothetical protein n=1 Tax=Mesorhizobium sp. M0955 TaxID=2957033 RepID=UPI003338D172